MEVVNDFEYSESEIGEAALAAPPNKLGLRTALVPHPNVKGESLRVIVWVCEDLLNLGIEISCPIYCKGHFSIKFTGGQTVSKRFEVGSKVFKADDGKSVIDGGKFEHKIRSLQPIDPDKFPARDSINVVAEDSILLDYVTFALQEIQTKPAYGYGACTVFHLQSTGGGTAEANKQSFFVGCAFLVNRNRDIYKLLNDTPEYKQGGAIEVPVTECELRGALSYLLRGQLQSEDHVLAAMRLATVFQLSPTTWTELRDLYDRLLLSITAKSVKNLTSCLNIAKHAITIEQDDMFRSAFRAANHNEHGRRLVTAVGKLYLNGADASPYTNKGLCLEPVDDSDSD